MMEKSAAVERSTGSYLSVVVWDKIDIDVIL